MTATDELRRMLDERGVEYVSSASGMSVYISPNTTAFANYSEDTLDVSMRNLTPEQAIEATLGRGTCEVEHELLGSHRCTACGARFFLDDDSGEPNFYDESGRATFPKFCPNCGRQVVS